MYSVGEMHVPCGTLLSNEKSGPVCWLICMEAVLSVIGVFCV